MTKNRIAYVTLQHGEQGQASYAHVREIVRGLRDLGWEVTLFEPNYRGTPSILSRGKEFMSVQWRFLAERRKFHCVYVRWHFATLPSVAWAKARREPVVLEVNGSYGDLFITWPWTSRLKPIFIVLMKQQLRWADVVVVVTESLAKWATQQGARNVFVIPNGADTEMFVPHTGPRPNLPDRYVVFFGHLAKWQGLETVLAAVAQGDWPESIPLVVVGDGPDRTLVERAATSESVIYLGRLPYREIPAIVSNALAALSIQDPLGDRGSNGVMPLKLFEALACATPVVVSDLPGQADLVLDGKCGLVVPSGDPRALVIALQRLLANEQVRADMGRRGRDLVVADHSWRARAATTAAALESAVQGRQP